MNQVILASGRCGNQGSHRAYSGTVCLAQGPDTEHVNTGKQDMLPVTTHPAY